MGVMNKLRENTGVILWILVFSFGIIWVLQDSEVFDTIGQPTGNIAVVNGAEITHQEYRDAVQQQMRQMREQMGGDLNPQMEDMIREQTYTQLVNMQLIEQEMDRLGIQVTDEEVMDMVYGDNPHPMIQQQFADDTGQVDRELIANLAQNPEMRESWLQMEQFLRDERRENKMNTLLQSTVHVSNRDVEEHHFRQNASADVEYVALNYASVSDEEVSVSDADLEAYYDENRDDFRRERTYEVRYAMLMKETTAEDSAAIAQDLEEMRAEFERTEAHEDFLRRNASVEEFTEDFLTRDELGPATANAIYDDLTVGRVTDPIFEEDGTVRIAKILDVEDAAEADEPAVQVAIMALPLQPSMATIRELEDRMDDISFYTNDGGDFEEEAEAQNVPVRTLTAQDGDADFPDLGQSRALRDFLSAASRGDVSDVIELDDRFVVAKVESIQRSGYIDFADVRSQIEPRVIQQKKQEHQVERMQSAFQGAASLEELAENLDTRLRTHDGLTFDEDVIPGLGRDPSFAGTVFGLEEGEQSNVVAGANAAFVVALTRWHEPAPLTESEREELHQELLAQRQQRVIEQWIESLRDKASIDDHRGQFEQM